MVEDHPAGYLALGLFCWQSSSLAGRMVSVPPGEKVAVFVDPVDGDRLVGLFGAVDDAAAADPWLATGQGDRFGFDM